MKCGKLLLDFLQLLLVNSKGTKVMNEASNKNIKNFADIAEKKIQESDGEFVKALSFIIK